VNSVTAHQIAKAGGVTIVLNVDTTNGRVGIGNVLPLAPLHVGGQNVNNSVDAMVLVSRAIGAETAGNAHAFSDSSDMNRAGGVAWNSFDARSKSSGVYNYDHHCGFQFAPILAQAGTLTKMYGFAIASQYDGGTLTNNYAFYAVDPTGAGVITNNYGLYIGALVRGTNNFAIYQSGAGKSYFGGNIGIGATSPAWRLEVLEPTNASVYGGFTARGGNEKIAGIIFRTLTGAAANTGGGIGHDGALNALFLVGDTGGGITIKHFVLGATGLVGIGTTAPLRRLEVNDASGNCLRLIYNDADGSPANYADLLVSSGGDLTLTPSGGDTSVTGRLASIPTSVTVANGAATFAVASNVVTVTGDAGGNTVATITGGLAGQLLTLIFVDTKVTITDTDAATANTVNLSAAFTSAANTVLQLVHNGTKWLEVSRSVNG
jgi:hypothetical protein